MRAIDEDGRCGRIAVQVEARRVKVGVLERCNYALVSLIRADIHSH